jgi:hypothetical protein
MIIARRSLLKGLGALFVAPAIVHIENLMPVRELMPSVPDWCPDGWLPLDGREIKKKFYPDLYASYERMRFPMCVSNDQVFETPFTYQPTGQPLKPQYARIISAKDIRRSNGTAMRAGVTSIILLPAAA